MNSQHPRLLTFFAILGLSIAACAPAQVDSARDAGPAPMPSAGTPITHVNIPASFNFQATARVDIHLQAASELPVGTPVVISRNNGTVIFRGAVPTSHELTIAYPLPKHEHTLQVTYRTADGSDHTQTLNVGADQTTTSTLGQE